MSLTPEEIALARERIRRWPRADRELLTRLTQPEVEAIVLLTALTDGHFVEEDDDADKRGP